MLPWLAVDGFILLVFGTLLTLLQAGAGGVQSAVCDGGLSIQGTSGVAGGKPCGEMERDLVAEAGSMNLSLIN